MRPQHPAAARSTRQPAARTQQLLLRPLAHALATGMMGLRACCMGMAACET
jgi:hypothetical protein